jgi:hypothetical protein
MTYDLHQVVSANYQCQNPPGASGVASCGGPVANGSPIDTSTTGAHTFTVTATSNDGQATSASTSYTVRAASAPRITALRIDPAAFRAAPGSGPSVGPTPRGTGATISWRDSQTATAVLTVYRVLHGHKGAQGACRLDKPGTHRQPGRACVKLVAVGTFSHADRERADSVHFTGRVDGKRLPPGAYSLRLVAHAGTISSTATAAFMIER